jgi:hypothetical protein
MTRLPLLALLLATPAVGQQATTTYPPYPGTPDARSETVVVTASGASGQRRFDLSTSAPQRDAMPQRRTVQEGSLHVTTGNPTFDALFAMAVDDARLDSVEEITDGSYNGGKPIPCHCFATGAKWPYVWTRDLSYALDLGLAGYDPSRAVAALTFKTGALRPGVPRPPELPADSLQIVQDTGSGGSWPVSTDRTAWALGAERTLANLQGPERAAFARTALAALTGTLEADRAAAFDPRDGLYGGEQSFLDWREQTYPAWIVDDLASMAEMKALSTNVLQYRAQRLAARLAREAGDRTTAARYDGWADALRPAIAHAFWDEKAGLFATLLTADPHPARVAKYDLLGNDLAILSGIASARQATRILSAYPFAPFGPPVVWPQAPDTFVYHNRAQWPFVTAYTLRAAAEVAHVAAADRSLDSLMRAAALHLSNMENLEWLTGRSQFDDGPEINSARQLWSVGGYLGAVTATLFGWHPEADGVSIAPFLTTHARALLGDTARLSGLGFAGKTVDVALALPPRARDGGWYPVHAVRLNGRPAPKRITPADLRDGGNLIEISFGTARRSTARVTEAPRVPPLSHDAARAFMPATPTYVMDGGGSVTIMSKPGLPHSVLRDGLTIARDVGRSWTDPSGTARATVCYSLVATDPATGFSSYPSAGTCARGTNAQTIGADDERVGGSAQLLSPRAGGAAPMRTLARDQTMTVRDVRIAHAGTYAVSLRYDNHLFQINTGVTNAVKRLTLTPMTGPALSAVIQMPHVRASGKTRLNDYNQRPGDTYPLHRSTRAYLRLEPGTYALTLTDFLNMSALTTNATYGGPGGAGGPVNEASVAAVLIDLVED